MRVYMLTWAGQHSYAAGGIGAHLHLHGTRGHHVSCNAVICHWLTAKRCVVYAAWYPDHLHAHEHM